MTVQGATVELDPGEVTQDALWRGALTFRQPARRCGYRFNLDPVLLAGFASRGGHILDFGAGCGIVGILLLAQGKAERVTAVEVQPALAALARHNAQANGLSHRFTAVTGDLRAVDLPQVDHVIFNPPYYPSASFRPCANPGRDQGRREQNGTLAHFVSRAFGALSRAGEAQVTAIVPAARHAELCRYIAAEGGTVVQQRRVLPRANGLAVHALVRAKRSGGKQVAPAPVPASVLESESACALAPESERQFEFGWEAPLVLHVGTSRGYTEEVCAWVNGPNCLSAADVSARHASVPLKT